MTLEAEAILTALRQGQPVADEVFDRLYPRPQRYRSEVHWTPIEVALRVAHLLADAPGGHVLDIGAGVGKACIVGALRTELVWHGVERDHVMVRTARRVARQLGVEDRTTFSSGEVTHRDWTGFGGFYLFNPFAESLFTNNVSDPGSRRAAYMAEVATVESKLAQSRPGTRVVTYHGFGGSVPDGYDLAAQEKIREDELSLWIRR